jgi:rubrerythrin
MYGFAFAFSRFGSKKSVGVATDRTIHYNSGCRRRVLVTGPVKKLLLGLVLEDAIIREENAYRFYESAAEKTSGEEPRKLLKKLCAEELRHRLKLEDLQGRAEVEQIELEQPSDVQLFEAEQSWPVVPAEATREEILKLALVKERQAARYYGLIAGRSALRIVKKLFLFLAAEETKHVRWIEKMLDEG